MTNGETVEAYINRAILKFFNDHNEGLNDLYYSKFAIENVNEHRGRILLFSTGITIPVRFLYWPKR
jgi:hypothetical protein